MLGRVPAEWSQMMGRRDATIAALELQRDAGLMASNITVLSQYVMALHRISLEVYQLLLRQEAFPTRVVEAAAPGPCIHHASIHMVVMGLWRPPVGPVGAEPILLHNDAECLGYPSCPGLPVDIY